MTAVFSGAKSLSKEKLNAVIDRIVVKNKAGAGLVSVVPDFAALPEEVKDEAYNQGSDGSDINGVHHNGKIYLLGT